MTKAQKIRLMMQQKNNGTNNPADNVKLTENSLQNLAKNQPQYQQVQPTTLGAEPQPIIQMESQPQHNEQRMGQGQYGPISNSQSDNQLEGNGANGRPDDYIQNIKGIGSVAYKNSLQP